MGFGDIVRSGVALADTLTQDLQATVQHHAWVGNDGYGADTYAAPVARLALVEWKQRPAIGAGGKELLTKAVLTFLRPVAAQGTAGRVEPIDPRDRFFLPDGTTGVTVLIEGMLDKATGKPYFTQVGLS